MEPNRYTITLKAADFEIGVDHLTCTAADVLLVDGLPLPQLLASLPTELLPDARHSVTLTDPADFEVTSEHLTCTAADVTLTTDLNASRLGALWSPLTDASGTVVAYSTGAEPGARPAV
ncbi:hypothetical protein ACFV42_23000 [Streptomyces solisilvae]|uniref:hypothetical protein n=1 Tax=Streptomyces malaysiensis TaxID=92644 RepID=UPI00368A9B53